MLLRCVCGKSFIFHCDDSVGSFWSDVAELSSGLSNLLFLLYILPLGLIITSFEPFLVIRMLTTINCASAFNWLNAVNGWTVNIFMQFNTNKTEFLIIPLELFLIHCSS